MAQSGFTPISLYFSATGAAVPIAGNLVAGELALNTNDGKLYFKNSSGVVTLLAGSTSGPAGGSTTQVQYNNAGVLAGITGATTNGTALTLVAPVLGTPASGTLTNATGLPLTTGVTGTLPVANGGTGVTTSTGTTNVVLSNSPTLVSPALGTPASGVVTNLTGTASININGTVGATTPAAGAFTTVSATGAVSINGASDVLSLSAPTANSGRNNITLRAKDASGNSSSVYFGQNIYNTDASLEIFGAAATHIGIAGNSNIANVTSTGLAVTGVLSTTGVATFAAGTVALPSITTSGDTNTGIYFPAADTVGITTGGTERGAFSSTGLAVTGALSATGTISSSALAAINLSNATYSQILSASNMYIDTTANNINIRPSGVAAGVFSSTGLAVTGTISSTKNVAFGGQALRAWGSAYAAIDLPGASFTSYSNNILNIVQGAYDTTAGNWLSTGYLLEATMFQQYNGLFSFLNAPASAGINDPVTFTERMRINSSGIVLIGTASATGSNLLQVNSDIRVNGLTLGKGASSVATNTGFGLNVFSAITTGSQNTAIGYVAGTFTTGVNNTAVGYGAYGATTGSGNTAVGALSLFANTSGASNTAVGSGALSSNISGVENTAVGDSALPNNKGSYNSGFGRFALANNTTASNNTAVGYNAGYSNATSSSQTFIGYRAGYNTTAQGNTFVGNDAGLVNTTGQDNTYIGKNSGVSMTTGSKNTILGIFNGNQGGLDIRTLSNSIVLSDGDGNPRWYIDSTGCAGYGPTTGGTVTQATSRTTGVTVNKPTGAITLVSAAGTILFQTFTVTNSTVSATDTIIVNQKSGTDLNIIHVTAVAAGSFNITFATTAGTTTEQPVFNFAVIKGQTA